MYVYCLQRVWFSPSAAYMRQWIGSALVQIMFGAIPLFKPTLGYYQLDFRNKVQWNFNQYEKLFIHENASENIVRFGWPFCPGGYELNSSKPRDTNTCHTTIGSDSGLSPVLCRSITWTNVVLMSIGKQISSIFETKFKNFYAIICI